VTSSWRAGGIGGRGCQMKTTWAAAPLTNVSKKNKAKMGNVFFIRVFNVCIFVGHQGPSPPFFYRNAHAKFPNYSQKFLARGARHLKHAADFETAASSISVNWIS